MTFLRLAYFSSATIDHFRAVARQLPDEAPPERLLFAAGVVTGGWQVVQLWHSQSALDDFNQNVFFPALNAIGHQTFPRAPHVVDFEPAILSLGSETSLG